MRRRHVLQGLAALTLPLPLRAAEGAEAALIAAADLGGLTAFAVADGATGRILAAQHAEKPLPPASVTKALTTLYAREHLGGGAVFSTQVLASGNLTAGRLEGDLILAGGGDPTLDTDRLGDLAAALAATGLRQISGRFLAYGHGLPYSPRIAEGQPDYVGYNPAISGLMANFARVNFVWAREGGRYRTEMNGEGRRFIPRITGAAVEVAQREAPLFAYEAESPIERWSVAAPALGKGGSRWLPLRRPTENAAELFAVLCAAHGITLPRAQITTALPQDAQPLAKDTSEPLDRVLAGMLKYSTNITAEAVGLAASGAGSLAASGAAMTAWARGAYGVTGTFDGHSGLGLGTLCSAQDLVQVMLGASRSAQGAALAGLMREQGLADAEGREVKESAVRIRAKSGTLNFTSALAGYVIAPQGRLAFAILSSDAARRVALPMEAREEPEGGSAWNKRARKMQRLMLRHWAKAYLP